MFKKIAEEEKNKNKFDRNPREDMHYLKIALRGANNANSTSPGYIQFDSQDPLFVILTTEQQLKVFLQ